MRHDLTHLELDLTRRQRAAQGEFRRFARCTVGYGLKATEHHPRLAQPIIREAAAAGYLGVAVPPEWSGGGCDFITLGLLHEEMGAASSSVQAVLTVHGMVAHAVLRWGTPAQRDAWLPKLARGDVIGAFALSELAAGSDIGGIEATICDDGGTRRLNGIKTWVTAGQIAEIFLVFARWDGKPSAVLVDRDTPGLTVRPRHDTLGFRAALLADLEFHDCCVPADRLLAARGFGLSHVASAALDMGRYTVAWGAAGLARTCVEVVERQARGTAPRTPASSAAVMHLGHLVATREAARLQCHYAGRLKDARHPNALFETLLAKHVASTVVGAAADTLLASGCPDDDFESYERVLRDARILQIIEGTTQVLQTTIADCYLSSERSGDSIH